MPDIATRQVNDPITLMARLCKARAKHGGSDNYHIFLNSVEGISRIVRLAGLVPEDCRIVCSRSENTKQRNLEKLPDGFSIESTTDPVKRFNFYTSTCFEGQDIYDENGRTFIISEKYKDRTKMDIQTSLLQICGRIRNSNYKMEINQFYSTSIYKEVSQEEFEATIQKKIDDAEFNAGLLDGLRGSTRENFINKYANSEPYIGVVDGRIIADRNLANLEIVNYGIVNGIYRSQCNMVAALKDAGLNIVESSFKEDPEEELEELKSIERTPFKDIFEEYCKLKEEKYDFSFRTSRIAKEKPLVVEAYDKLGPEKVREMKYHVSNIKQELVKVMHETLDTKVFLIIDKQFEKGAAILKSEIKAVLNKAYRDLGINYKAKATDLNR